MITLHRFEGKVEKSGTTFYIYGDVTRWRNVDKNTIVTIT